MSLLFVPIQTPTWNWIPHFIQLKLKCNSFCHFPNNFVSKIYLVRYFLVRIFLIPSLLYIYKKLPSYLIFNRPLNLLFFFFGHHAPQVHHQHLLIHRRKKPLSTNITIIFFALLSFSRISNFFFRIFFQIIFFLWRSSLSFDIQSCPHNLLRLNFLYMTINEENSLLVHHSYPIQGKFYSSVSHILMFLSFDSCFWGLKIFQKRVTDNVQEGSSRIEAMIRPSKCIRLFSTFRMRSAENRLQESSVIFFLEVRNSKH